MSDAERDALVYLTQYMFPDGRKNRVSVVLGPEYAKRARGMALSCECCGARVTLYGRLFTDDEENEEVVFATNGPGPESPVEMTKRLIDAVHARAALAKAEGKS